MPPALRLLYTADLHNRLTPALAERLRQVKRDHEALLVDGGDAVAAPNVLVYPRPERAVRLLGAAGCDLMGLGNREYFFRRWGLRRKTGGASFPVLCSNLVAVGPGLPEEAEHGAGVEHLRRWMVLEGAGRRVGFFGLCPEMIVPGTWAERCSDMRFVPWQEAAATASEALRPQCDLIVALAHVGAPTQEALAQAHPEVALILGAHTHGPAVELLTAAGVPIVRVPPHARAAALVALEPEAGALPQVTEVPLQ